VRRVAGSNESFTCNRCDYCVNSNRDGGTNVGDEYWCEDCVSNNATYCEECDEYYRDGQRVRELWWW
jgi:hypothetical protein